jgi:CheY-like chemotaxis protein
MNETKTVLFADDEEDICRGARLWLTHAGFRAHLVRDGAQAVAAAQSLRPDAIVLDVRMPNKDGLTALCELHQRADTRDIPVIMLSASLRDQQATLDAGARFFLTKPYEPKALVAAVEAAIDGA